MYRVGNNDVNDNTPDLTLSLRFEIYENVVGISQLKDSRALSAEGPKSR